MTREQLIREGYRLGFNFEDTDSRETILREIGEETETFTKRELETQ